MLSLSDTPELSDDEGEEGRSLRFSQFACLGMEPLPQDPGKKLWGPQHPPWYLLSVELPFDEWGLGRRRESLHPVCNHLGLSLSIRHLGVGWEMLKFCSPQEENPLAGNWGERQPCAFDCCSLGQSFHLPELQSSVQGGSNLGSNTTDLNSSYQIFIDFSWIAMSSFAVCF